MKKSLSTNYLFKDNQNLKITLGYKEMGVLNKNKDNVVLVCHSFSSTSNFAGVDCNGNKGYWDDLIGDKKAIDTNKYYVISFDNLSNVQYYNDDVITTGPRSLNENNQRYDLDFPIFTFRDIVKIQYDLLFKKLGINHLKMVIGPSAGGFAAWHWGIEFPDDVDTIVPIVTNPKTSSWAKSILLNTSLRALEIDSKWNNGSYEKDNRPKKGLALGINTMNMVDFKKSYYEELYPYQKNNILANHQDESYVIKKMDEELIAPLKLIDPAHYYYMCKAMMQYDISEGYNSLEEALNRVKSKIKIISCKDDILFPYSYNYEAINMLKKLNKDVSVYEYEHHLGHMSGILQPKNYEEEIKKYL